ncbi:Pescadillo N-terminus-domain-containing protein [Syncephalis pseudoplumigaleata]|uniref:Pescadillo homolog n=1 Tax=Syncephalis pseudoplumigaleata TaxID=1712513 RepID=A0A4P9YU71_9FUNG|nr:Pescadillo N-terminus-domain-containing protein [Syncephalis pseudoplumigaleata]|eukprot:RKP23563.1 Pescadillo N-terminus-domain-containing protein [Syncephalis pseudoplumigaleata]
MGKLQKKGKSGAAVKYITRNQALKKLQVTLADFRRICIIKGVYPREPKNKKKANQGSTASRTFYYYKDIQYLLHEPLLNHFRDHKAYLRKVTRALAKKNLSAARALRDNRPTYSLHHIVRERYPSFIYALRDLDDALCLLFLFATFPVNDKIKAPLVAECQRLTAEFQHYVMRAKCIRKVFLSIKGIYYQAEIKGQQITWLVPYQFVQQIPGDVDLRVMLTFLEFYRTLIGFVNYRLYNELSLVYPPKIDYAKVAEGAEVDAMQIESKLFDWSKHATVTEEHATDATANRSDMIEASEKRLETLSAKLSDITQADKDGEDAAMEDGAEDAATAEAASLDAFAEPEAAGEEGDVAKPLLLNAAGVHGQDRGQLFAKCIFYLSREVPRNSLEFVVRACGGQVGWDAILGAGSQVSEGDDRVTHHVSDRPNPDRSYYGRSYVQPQWIYDCINAGKLLDTEQYAPGATLPAHLSPFVKYEAGDYVPAEAHVLDETLAQNEADKTMVEASSDDEEQHQMELEAEAAGVNYSEYQTEAAASTAAAKKKQKQKAASALVAEQEKQKMATIMMSKKDRQLYSSIRQEQVKKEAKARRLQRKKDALQEKS